ncbi:MAG: RDD family protein [Thermoanaerobaculia bacterium]|nr:RDD family protein [Thermoanaerobaculia bacterium]
METSQTTLLRIAAFLVDALSISIVLVLPASLVSYAMAWIGGSVKVIQLVWWVALGIIVIALLIRDGFRGRSLGKQILGLRMLTPRGEHCGYGRSVVRNIPLIVPIWNVVEVALVLAGKPRTGDRIARTTVTKE